MRHFITVIISVFTLISVGCNQVITTNNDTTIGNGIVSEVFISDDEVILLLEDSYYGSDILITVPFDIYVYNPLDQPVNPTEIEVGDIVTIYFDSVLESDPLQAIATSMEVK